MKILAINRYFGNDDVPTGRMLRDLSDAVVKQGHRVTVLTTSTHDAGEGGPELIRRESHCGGSGPPERKTAS